MTAPPQCASRDPGASASVRAHRVSDSRVQSASASGRAHHASGRAHRASTSRDLGATSVDKYTAPASVVISAPVPVDGYFMPAPAA